ncbi:hypothetical protein MMC07_009391 [Pseudocyphellaria aurata]|nr:hypothetical protein [Pseudocyphellaria aurata]
MPPRLVLDEADIEEAFLKGSGPGGQKINKTACAVQLKHIPSGLVVRCQATRSRAQNRKVARQLLADKIEENEKGPDSRIALKQQIKRNKNADRRKKAKRKYGKKEGDEADKVPVEDNKAGLKEVDGKTG